MLLCRSGLSLPHVRERLWFGQYHSLMGDGRLVEGVIGDLFVLWQAFPVRGKAVYFFYSLHSKYAVSGHRSSRGTILGLSLYM